MRLRTAASPGPTPRRHARRLARRPRPLCSVPRHRRSPLGPPLYNVAYSTEPLHGVFRMQIPVVDFSDDRLSNGLRLILAEDHLAPVVAVNVWYDVGSKHEQPGKTGF